MVRKVQPCGLNVLQSTSQALHLCVSGGIWRTWFLFWCVVEATMVRFLHHGQVETRDPNLPARKGTRLVPKEPHLVDRGVGRRLEHGRRFTDHIGFRLHQRVEARTRKLHTVSCSKPTTS